VKRFQNRGVSCQLALDGAFLNSNGQAGSSPHDPWALLKPTLVAKLDYSGSVRSADTADEDRQSVPEADRTANPAPAQAALLFSCNGRGTRLFPAAHHDAATLQKIGGPIPLAGFFAQGELGPIGSRNYLHGFTASIALFE